MTTFLDGPAGAQHLMLRRAPLLLRVVRYKGTDRRRIGWDALDQVEDQPRRDEEVYVYILAEEPHWLHLLIRGKGRKDGGFYWDGKYKYLNPQPPDDVVRDNRKWQAWCFECRDWLAPAWWRPWKQKQRNPQGDTHVGSDTANPQASTPDHHGPPGAGSAAAQ